MPEAVRVGLIGCGNISDIYVRNCRRFDGLDLVAVSDLLPERARAKADEHGVARALTVDELLADPDVELVVNLTIPNAHAEVSERALLAGKSVYSEKPLATTREAGRRLLDLAEERGLLLGCAPDTFLGAGLQTCRRLVDEGAIGEPVAATAFMMSRGPDVWHPDPAFFFQPGAGPMFDMGPYYLTALVNLLGPVRRVAGAARASFAERVVGSGPLAGNRVAVETPTHVSALLEFASGASVALVTSFDVSASALPRIEVYGADATLSAPDPNTFGGPVRIGRPGAEWEEVELRGHSDNSRGIGLADLARSRAEGRPARASGELAFHVLDVMQTVLESAAEGRTIELSSRCERPAPLAPDGDTAPA